MSLLPSSSLPQMQFANISFNSEGDGGILLGSRFFVKVVLQFPNTVSRNVPGAIQNEEVQRSRESGLLLEYATKNWSASSQGLSDNCADIFDEQEISSSVI